MIYNLCEVGDIQHLRVDDIQLKELMIYKALPWLWETRHVPSTVILSGGQSPKPKPEGRPTARGSRTERCSSASWFDVSFLYPERADSIQGLRLDAIPCGARIPYRFADSILRRAQIPYSPRGWWYATSVRLVIYNTCVLMIFSPAGWWYTRLAPWFCSLLARKKGLMPYRAEHGFHTALCADYTGISCAQMWTNCKYN